MDRRPWRDVLRETQPADGLAELFDELERFGWYARTRSGEYGLRFWPDDGRRRQIVIDTRHPLNDHKLEHYRMHTGLPLHMEIEEGGNR